MPANIISEMLAINISVMLAIVNYRMLAFQFFEMLAVIISRCWQFQFSEMLTIIVPRSAGNYNFRNAGTYKFRNAGNCFFFISKQEWQLTFSNILTMIFVSDMRPIIISKMLANLISGFAKCWQSYFSEMLALIFARSADNYIFEMLAIILFRSAGCHNFSKLEL